MLAYHTQTMHSYRSVRTKSNSIDWDHPPKQFKIYPETFKRIPLDKTNPDHLFFYLIGGITAQKSYPGVTYALRTNPSAGALYPTEIYALQPTHPRYPLRRLHQWLFADDSSKKHIHHVYTHKHDVRQWHTKYR